MISMGDDGRFIHSFEEGGSSLVGSKIRQRSPTMWIRVNVAYVVAVGFVKGDDFVVRGKEVNKKNPLQPRTDVGLIGPW